MSEEVDAVVLAVATGAVVVLLLVALAPLAGVFKIIDRYERLLRKE